ncbi:hypothetical protein ACFSQD_08595 [Flavihumibacter stibioxidans]|uniref:Uncharacterized protein n=1 Tax=Flavihumibacter stibioxidans TaxID=1834163 RepID=A0ABR7M5R7_9BACT|nr:hypothetical protein [Flavihumibacter stibioxidans]MBC6490366.1 hypothetical protein [Flavihumibacter stibioxidans]
MNNIFWRVTALFLHAMGNIIAGSYLTSFDITGSWLYVSIFVLVMILLLFLFITHLFSFIKYIKTNSK